MIPILIICYNNYIYVDNMIKQIKKINPEYFSYISIVNNSSTDKDTISYLETCSVNIIQNKNNGPWISQDCNKHIYDTLPEQYIITDPDLQLHKNIPSNFIEILSNLSEKYHCRKIGFDTEIKNNIFSIDTPPPTISGTLHIGHVFSYCQADFIARFNRMIGKNVFGRIK